MNSIHITFNLAINYIIDDTSDNIIYNIINDEIYSITEDNLEIWK